MLKINYLIPSNKNQILLGKIIFLEKYQSPSIDFPYFYLNSVNETLNISNWPDLVPYLYNKTLGFFVYENNNYFFKNVFEVYSFFLINQNEIILKFINVNSIKALLAIEEDRKMHYYDNGNYENWNRTITVKNDFKTIDNNLILFQDFNYKILDIDIQNENLATLKLSIINNRIYQEEQFVVNSLIEFGLYRLSGNNKNIIYYNYVKNKYFSTPSESDFIGGLRYRSQIIGHAHEHTHNMSHTHTMVHTHDLSNHIHHMNHQHDYNDRRSTDIGMGNGPGDFFSSAGHTRNQTRTTNYTRDNTNPPNVNSTGQASLTLSSVPNNNNLTGISSKTINQDGLNTNINNFRYSDKNNYDSIFYYTYIYGASYLVT